MVKTSGIKHARNDGIIKHTTLIEYIRISGRAQGSAAVETSAAAIRPDPPSFAKPSSFAKATEDGTEGRPSEFLAHPVMVLSPSSHTFLALTRED